MEQVSIEILRREEVQEAAKVAARALAPTPFPSAMFGGLKKTERVMEATIKLTFGRWPGQVLVAKKDNRVVGVLRMVEWPQCQMSSGQALRLVPTMLKILGVGVIRAMKGRAVWAKHDPKEPHWHLDPVAVMPEMQGQGIGVNYWNASACLWMRLRSQLILKLTDQRTYVSTSVSVSP